MMFGLFVVVLYAVFVWIDLFGLIVVFVFVCCWFCLFCLFRLFWVALFVLLVLCCWFSLC